ncbi:MAG: sensor histidine kinase [Gammaproteobacteria bacterium]|nr:sensor histidine kinase [Gammaproteobacteria bacterium]
MWRSLQARLAVGLIVSLVAALLLQWLVANSAVEVLLKNNAAKHLEEDAELVLAALRVSPEGVLSIDAARIDPNYLRPFSGHYFRIQSDTLVIRSRSLWDTDLQISTPATSDFIQSETGGPAQQHLLMVMREFHKFDRAIVVSVAEDIEPLYIDARAFQWRYALLAVGILVTLVGLQTWWVRRGLRPLDDIRAELRALEQGALRQLTVTYAPREVQPLVQQINRLLELLQKRLERSRNALGNLAHGLKTPLTALMQQFDQAEISQYPVLKSRLQQHTHTVHQLIERELKRARVVGAALPSGHYDLAAEVESLVQMLRRVYRDKQLDIETRIPRNSACRLDREDLFELLGNLLDNACKWAATRVRLTIEAQPLWTFTVEDDGPGVEQQELDKLTLRGVRVDENTAGHGLGLSIAKDLVEHYGGELLLGRSDELGGFYCSARIPLV